MAAKVDELGREVRQMATTVQFPPEMTRSVRLIAETAASTKASAAAGAAVAALVSSTASGQHSQGNIGDLRLRIRRLTDRGEHHLKTLDATAYGLRDEINRTLEGQTDVRVDSARLLPSGDVELQLHDYRTREECTAQAAAWLSPLLFECQVTRPTYPVLVHRVPLDKFNPTQIEEASRRLLGENPALDGAEVLHMQWLDWKAVQQARKSKSKAKSSVVVGFGHPQDANSAIRLGVSWAGTPLESVKYDGGTRILQCYNCQQYGHNGKRCQSKPRCITCAGTHRSKKCPPGSQLRCAVCSGEHPANSQVCEKRKEENARGEAARALLTPYYEVPYPKPSQLTERAAQHKQHEDRSSRTTQSNNTERKTTAQEKIQGSQPTRGTITNHTTLKRKYNDNTPDTHSFIEPYSTPGYTIWRSPSKIKPYTRKLRSNVQQPLTATPTPRTDMPSPTQRQRHPDSTEDSEAALEIQGKIKRVRTTLTTPEIEEHRAFLEAAQRAAATPRDSPSDHGNPRVTVGLVEDLQTYERRLQELEEAQRPVKEARKRIQLYGKTPRKPRARKARMTEHDTQTPDNQGQTMAAPPPSSPPERYWSQPGLGNKRPLPSTNRDRTQHPVPPGKAPPESPRSRKKPRHRSRNRKAAARTKAPREA